MTSEEIKFFDRLSAEWDNNEVLSTPEKVKEILSLVGVKDGMNILDLGTGTGVLIPFLSELTGYNGKVVGVDMSEGMLGKASEKYGNLKNAELLRLDFEEEPVNGKYDLIMLYCVYPHLHRPEETLKRLCADNLNPEGRIIIAFPASETYINNIHKEKKAAGELLPDAYTLSEKMNDRGFTAEVVKYDAETYIVSLRRPQTVMPE